MAITDTKLTKDQANALWAKLITPQNDFENVIKYLELKHPYEAELIVEGQTLRTCMAHFVSKLRSMTEAPEEGGA